MAEILPIRRETLSNQSINQSINITIKHIRENKRQRHDFYRKRVEGRPIQWLQWYQASPRSVVYTFKTINFWLIHIHLTSETRICI